MHADLGTNTRERVENNQTKQAHEVARILERGRHIIRTLLRLLQDAVFMYAGSYERNGSPSPTRICARSRARIMPSSIGSSY